MKTNELNYWNQINVLTFESSRDINIGKLLKLLKHSAVKKTATMTLDNYFKRQTISENETRVEIEATQSNLTNIEETDAHDAL